MSSRNALLLVEADPAVRSELATALSVEGFRVMEAGDLQTARSLLTAQPFSALVTELQLPDGPGLDLVRDSGPTEVRHSGISVFRHFGIPEFRYSGIPAFRYFGN